MEGRDRAGAHSEGQDVGKETRAGAVEITVTGGAGRVGARALPSRPTQSGTPRGLVVRGVLHPLSMTEPRSTGRCGGHAPPGPCPVCSEAVT
jgi:hypothetical protein